MEACWTGLWLLPLEHEKLTRGSLGGLGRPLTPSRASACHVTGPPLRVDAARLLRCEARRYGSDHDVICKHDSANGVIGLSLEAATLGTLLFFLFFFPFFTRVKQMWPRVQQLRVLVLHGRLLPPGGRLYKATQQPVINTSCNNGLALKSCSARLKKQTTFVYARN